MKNSTRIAVVQALVASAVLVVCVPPAAAQDCPELLGRWPYGPASAVAVSGSLAFVGSGTMLQVVDISTPDSPQLLGELTLPGVALGVAVAGNHAYVVDGYDGLRVIDVSVPSAPVEVGFLDTPGPAMDVAVAGGLAFVAEGHWEPLVVDISTPAAPAALGILDTNGKAIAIAVVAYRCQA